MVTKILLFFFSASFLFSQSFKFSGFIRDASSGDPLAFANISSADNRVGTSTNSDGEFEINLKPGNYEFIVSYIGYKHLQGKKNQ